MKKIILTLTVLATAIAFTSCDNGSENTVNDISPDLILDGSNPFISSDKVVNYGDTLRFKVSAFENAETKKNLKNVNIVRVFNNDPVTVLDSNFTDSEFGPLSITTIAQDTTGEEKWIFSVTDKDGQTDEEELIITSVDPNPELEGMFYHIGGSLKGAFNIVGDTLVSSASSDLLKDVSNSDDAGSTFTGSFVSKNGTMFRSASITFDYDNATQASIETDYNRVEILNGPDSVVANPAVNDVYLVKLRGEETYAVIKITALDANNNDCTCANTGKLEFMYKKN